MMGEVKGNYRVEEVDVSGMGKLDDLSLLLPFSLLVFFFLSLLYLFPLSLLLPFFSCSCFYFIAFFSLFSISFGIRVEE